MRGAGRLILVGGEPGIGKTRLCVELGAAAETRRAGVLWGSCWETGGAPAFWPWIQVLRRYVRGRDPAELRAELAGSAADVARLLPELAAPLPRAAAEPESDRFRLFDTLTSFLRAAGDARPQLIVLDDLHWADTASLLMLRFLACELHRSHLLVVGTYRQVELGRAPGRAELLAELTRVDQHLVLTGLPQTDIARLVSNLTGVEPAREVTAALHRETGGNPFFVREIVGLLGPHGDLASGVTARRVPEGVRGLIQRRLEHLSPDCRALLDAAAVVGHEFRLDLVAAAAEVERDRQLELTQEAVEASLIEAAPDAPGSCRFVHALVREVVYDELTVAERTRLHRRVGETLEATFAGDSSRLAELAHHFFQAALDGTADKAARYATAAADHALEQLAYEQAVEHFKRALQALDGQVSVDRARRCAVLASLGKAQMAASLVPEARATLEAAATLARTLGSGELLAQAALAVSMEFTAGTVDDLEVGLLEQALDALGPADGPWRARVLARLAKALPACEVGRERAGSIPGSAQGVIHAQ